MVGFGYDSHRFSPEGKLFIGGIEIDSGFGVVAHSDGDVLIHALIDALLGACCLGDIGEHFPDSEAKYKSISSSLLLSKILDLIKKENFIITNIDCTIVLEHPKLMNYKYKIKENLGLLCDLPANRINIKAKSNEKMGFIGRGEGIVAFCICQIEKN